MVGSKPSCFCSVSVRYPGFTRRFRTGVQPSGPTGHGEHCLSASQPSALLTMAAAISAGALASTESPRESWGSFSLSQASTIPVEVDTGFMGGLRREVQVEDLYSLFCAARRTDIVQLVNGMAPSYFLLAHLTGQEVRLYQIHINLVVRDTAREVRWEIRHYCLL